MATTTAALPDGTKLTMPAYTDSADIAVINTNMDNIANNINLLNSNKVDKNSRVIIDRNESASISDCDTITELGMYRIINSTANRPSNISYGTLIYFRSFNYHAQLAISTGGAFAVRGKGEGDTWGTWKTVTTT